jgi:hypothetical protein
MPLVPHENGGFGEVHPVKIAALATSFVIGFITGISFLPAPNHELPELKTEQIRRADNKQVD